VTFPPITKRFSVIDGVKNRQSSGYNVLGIVMRDESYVSGLARRCRELGRTTTEPEVIEQLRVWATELAEMAEDLDGASLFAHHQVIGIAA
jgi:hypothetical protein